MPRELRIGDRVRTPWGDGVVASAVYQGMRGHTYDVAIRTEKGGEPAVHVSSWHVDNLEPLPSDIPRERVADLHAAVVKRVWMLADEMSHEGHESDDVRGYPHPRICLTCTRDEEHEVEFYVREGADAEIARAAHDELATFAEALRLLLEEVLNA